VLRPVIGFDKDEVLGIAGILLPLTLAALYIPGKKEYFPD
jgi:hypothetical protein